MHDGQITAASEGKGHGAVFRLTLPVIDTARSGAAAAQRPREDDGRAGPRMHARVLVADDNVDAASSVAMMLELDGYEVEIAHDGHQAIERAAAARPDAMVVDIGMPGADGYEVARRVRRSAWGRDVLLVATTGWGQPEDKQRAVEAGFDAHFTKPVYPEHLRELLAARLARQ